MWLPTKPAPPATRTRMIASLPAGGWSSNAIALTK
jgi:hypothetical protein